MMVNSNVPRYSNLASELLRNYFFKFKLFLSSARSNTHMMDPVVRTDYKLAPFQLQQLIWWNRTASINFERWLQQCLRKNKTRPIFHSQKLKVFSKTCATSFTFEQFHWFIQLCNETLQTRKVLAPFSFSHVIDSCSLFISFSFFAFLSWFFS